MNKLIKNKRIVATIVLILLIGVLLPSGSVFAQGAEVFEALNPLRLINGLLAWSNATYLSGVGSFIQWAAQTLEWVVSAPVQGYILSYGVVDESWNIIRNFVNMFFILFLIIMAFGTIFDVNRYTWKDLLGPFLVAALLVNFSLVIGKYVIQIGNGLAQVFLTQIGTFSTSLANGLNIQAGIPSSTVLGRAIDAFQAATVNNPTQVFVNFIGGFFFLIISLFVLLASLLFTLIRIPVLWLLLIVSPLAWVSYILPNTRTMWSKWWNYLISWTFFLPVYLFFLMIAVGFIANRGGLVGMQNAAINGLTIGPGAAVNNFVMWLLTIIFMVGGIIYSFKVGSLAANGVGAAMGKIQGGLQRVSGYSALATGVRKTKERIEEEGLPGRARILYGGAQAEQQRAARMTERVQKAMGFTPDITSQKQFVSNADKEYDRIKQQYDLGKIDIAMIRSEIGKSKANTPSGFAYRKLLADLGQMDETTAFDTLKSLKNNPYAASEFAKMAAKSKWSTVRPEEVLEMASGAGSLLASGKHTYEELKTDSNYIMARREMYKFVQSDARALAKMTAPQFIAGLDLMGGQTTREGSEYLKDVGKIRPDLVADYRHAHPTPGASLTREQIMASFVTGAENIAAFPLDVWNDHDFQRVMYDRLNHKAPLGSTAAKDRTRTNIEQKIVENGRDVAAKQLIVDKLSDSSIPRLP